MNFDLNLLSFGTHGLHQVHLSFGRKLSLNGAERLSPFSLPNHRCFVCPLVRVPSTWMVYRRAIISTDDKTNPHSRCFSVVISMDANVVISNIT